MMTRDLQKLPIAHQYTTEPCAIASETYPSGGTIATSYDLASRPSSLSGNLSGNGTSYANAFTDAPHGRVTSLILKGTKRSASFSAS